MKLNTRNMKSKSGMTLLELTVVILVLLSLISILFVGARAWKRGSDRSANIMNIRNVQQAVRGHENMRNLTAGTSNLASSEIISADGTTGYLKTPKPPANLAAYTYGDKVPNTGTLYVTNHFDDAIYGFTAATDYADW
jgi:prepilin-type N-terminal cleavage/methylation domain-containing protein